MLKPCEDLDLAQCPLAVGLVLERRDLLDGHSRLCDIVVGRSVTTKRDTYVSQWTNSGYDC